MAYPNLNTPKISQPTGYAPNPSPTDPETNPLARTEVNLPVNSPELLNNAGFGAPSPGLMGEFGPGRSYAQSTFEAGNMFMANAGNQPFNGGYSENGFANQQFAQSGYQQMSIQPEEQAYFNQHISNRISRPILPRHSEQFYSSLSLDQKLQFFSGPQQVDNQASKMQWNPMLQEIPQETQQPVAEMLEAQPENLQMPPFSMIPGNPAAISALSQEETITEPVEEPAKFEQQQESKGAHGSGEDENELDSKKFFELLRSTLFEQQNSSLEELEILDKRFHLKPTIEEIKQDCNRVANFSFSNEYGEVSFSCPIDLSVVCADDFWIKYGDFGIPLELERRMHIIVLQGIWIEPGSVELLQKEAESRGLKFVCYNSELKKLVMSSK